MTDPIADYLTRLRNALMARHNFVEIPFSKMKESITRVLKEQGYVSEYEVNSPEKITHKVIKIGLKYDARTRQPIIQKLKRVSTPGLRQYTNVANMPSIINGLGIAVISTSRGILTDKEARKAKVGGEVLCYVY